MSFVRYSTDDSVISSETVVRGMWTNDTASLTTFFTTSLAVNTSSYFVNVYDTSTTSSNQFSIQYGHVSGSGSDAINSSVAGITPTRINYGQYRSLIYNDENAAFVFGSVTSPDFYALSIARSRFKESIKPGSLSLTLKSGSNQITLTDDSVVSGSASNFIGSNRYYTLISGSEGTAYASPTNGNSGSYGMLFPDLGVMLLNARALSADSSNGGLGFVSNTGSVSADNENQIELFKIISGSDASGNFTLNSQETVSSRYFFTRVKNSEFNYTTNPSVINSSGSVLFDTLIDNPQTYITTVGMYNDNNELLAVAKLSRPLVKDFTKEALIRVKLDY